MMRSSSPAGRRYTARILVSMAAYAGLLVATIELFRRAAPGGALKYVLALLPALPIVAVVAFMALYLKEEGDEFRRMKTTQGMLGGLLLTLAGGTVWGFLEVFADAPHVPLYWVFPIFCVGMGLSAAVLEWRYRA